MSNDKPLKIGVVGTGVMGGFHLKNYKAMDKSKVVLAGVFDVDEARAKAAAAEYDTVAYTKLEDLAENIDAASVVTTSVTHGAVGEVLLNKGIACLIEKPLAVSKLECLELIDAAAASNTVLQVGHVELFNPAVIKLREILTLQKPEIHFISAARMSEASGRITDVGVISDLMIHDIYVIQDLLGALPVRTMADGFGAGVDCATASLHFQNGAYAVLSASRIVKNRIRTLDVFTSIGQFHLDYIAQTLTLTNAGGVQDFPVEKGFSLEKELKDFTRCAKEKKTPLVTGQKALESLEIVWEAERYLQQS